MKSSSEQCDQAFKDVILCLCSRQGEQKESSDAGTQCATAVQSADAETQITTSEAQKCASTSGGGSAEPHGTSTATPVNTTERSTQCRDAEFEGEDDDGVESHTRSGKGKGGKEDSRTGKGGRRKKCRQKVSS